MGTYRAYVLDQNDRVMKAHVLAAQDDEAALNEARRYLDDHDIEVWHADHVLAKLPSLRRTQRAP
jgi:hypothetical protein